MLYKSAVGVVALRGTSLALAVAGQVAAANALNALADLLEAGQATDEHMQLVADKLKAGAVTAADWTDVGNRIDFDRARLQSVGKVPPAAPPPTEPASANETGPAT